MTIHVEMKNCLSGLFCLLMAVGGLACNEVPNCSSGNENILKIKFTNITFDTESDVFVLSDTLLPVNQVRSEARPDSLILAEADTTTLLSLPVNPFADTTGFIITIAGTDYTFRVGYEREARLIAPECGIEQVYKDLQIGGSLPGDSIILINDRLLKPTDQSTNINVEIYF